MATTNGHGTSLAQLEREAARDREALVNTIEALQDRISPTAIKRDVQDYVRDKKEGILRSFEQRARENPLQTVAIAAVAAYPLWRIVTSIPAPLLLVGAGLALARTSGRNGFSSGTGPGFVDQARQRLGEATDGVKQKFEEASATVRQTAQQTVQAAQQTAQQTMQGAQQTMEAAREKAEQTAGTARAMSSEAVSTASEMVSSGRRDAAESIARAREQMQQTGQQARETFAETIQRHPIVVGAVGLAIGAIMAAALPVTRQEEQLLGAAGNELKKKAQGAASDGIAAVKGAARDVYEDTAAYAREQGLSPDGMREAAANVGDKVKEVIAKATEGSAGRPAQSDQPKGAVAQPHETRRYDQ
jgi:lambda repressor-like predicted transcriptional regulator